MLRLGAPIALVLTLAPLTAHAQSRPSASESAAALMGRAIARAGGAVALEAARALRWEGDAVVHVGGRDIAIRGTWEIQPPDSAVVATYDTTTGPATMRRLIVSGPRGWIESNGRFDPMPASMLASEHVEFYLYQLMRLAPLRAPGVTLRAAAPDSLGQRGVVVAHAGRPDVTAWMDAAGRLAHLALTIPDAESGAPRRQDVWLAGSVQAGGIAWPATIRLTMDGAPYFDLSIRSLGVSRQLQSPYLEGRAP